ncbi:MAG: amidohydrolase family protein [Candidatus Hodarchaeales archaeon]
MIIDSHAHVSGPPFTQDFLQCQTADGSFVTMPFRRKDCSVDHLLQAMTDHGIDRALVNAFTGVISNEQLASVIEEYPKKFIGFAWIDDPLNPEEAVPALEDAYTSLGLRGLKLHPGLQGFNPADPRLYPLIQQAADLNIPTFIHMFPWPPGTFHLHYPEHISTLKKNVPDAIIMVGHMAYQRYMDLEVLAWEPGIVIETSFGLDLIASLHGIDFAERVLRRIGINKVVFGSDWCGTQDGTARIVEYNLDLFNQMNLTPEEKEAILGGNIHQLLGI